MSRIDRDKELNIDEFEARMADRGHSVTTLADKVGINRKTLRAWIKGVTKRPNNSTLEKVAQELKVAASSLLQSRGQRSANVPVPPPGNRLQDRLRRYGRVLERSLDGLYQLGATGPPRTRSGRCYVGRRLLHEEKTVADESRRPSAVVGQPAGLDELVDRRTVQTGDTDFLDRLIGSRPSEPTRICIVGDAGLGKSCLLGQLAWQLAARLSNKPTLGRDGNRFVPVLVRLCGWPSDGRKRDKRLHALVIESFLSVTDNLGATVSKKDLAELLEGGHVVLLLDGLDEVPSFQARRAFEDALRSAIHGGFLRTCSIVLASRPEVLSVETGIWQLGFERHQLAPLSRHETETYVAGHFESEPARARALCGQLDDATAGLTRLLQRPLLLSLLCIINTRGEVRLPASGRDLLEKGVRALLSQRGLKDRPGQRLEPQSELTDRLMALLGKMAEPCVEAGSISFSAAQRAAEEATSESELIRTTFAGISVLDHLAERTGTLVRLANGRYAFAERSFAEFLCGRWFAFMPETAVLSKVRERAWRLEWHETVGWMLDELWQETRGLARTIVKWLVKHVEDKRDYLTGTVAMLAARGIAGVGGSLAAEEQELVIRVGHTVTVSAILSHNFHNHDGVFEDTSNIWSKRLAMMPLSARRPAASVAADCLCSSATRSNRLGATLCTHLLNLRVQSPAVKKALYCVLQDSKAASAWHEAAQALCSLGELPDAVIDVLVSSLENQKERGPWGDAFGVLCDLGAAPDPVVDVLLGILRDPERHYLWRDVAHTLSERGLPLDTAINMLAEFLNGRKQRFLWHDAAYALGIVGVSSDAVARVLVGVLKDPSRRSSWNDVARMLRQRGISSDAAVRALAGLLKDRRQKFLWYDAAYVLGILGVSSDAMIKVLVGTFKYPDRRSRWADTAQMLRVLGVSSEASKRALMRVLNDPDRSSDWCDASDALYQLGVQAGEIVDVVAGILKSPEARGTWSDAVEVLGDLAFSSDTFVTALMVVLEDSKTRDAWRNAVRQVCERDGASVAVAYLLVRLPLGPQASYRYLSALRVMANLISVSPVGKTSFRCRLRVLRHTVGQAWDVRNTDYVYGECLRETKDEAVQSLADTLRCATNDIERQNAAWTLGMLATKPAVQALIDQDYLPLAMAASQSGGLSIDFSGGKASAVELAELRLDEDLYPGGWPIDKPPSIPSG